MSEEAIDQIMLPSLEAAVQACLDLGLEIPPQWNVPPELLANLKPNPDSVPEEYRNAS